MEQEEYIKEEIDWSYIEFIDNQVVLDIIEKLSCCLPLYIFTHITRHTCVKNYNLSNFAPLGFISLVYKWFCCYDDSKT